MDTLLRLFQDHPLTAAIAVISLLLATVLPITGRRFPRLILRVAGSLLRAVTVPFNFWRVTVLDLASRSGVAAADGTTPLARRLLPVVQSVLILGGVAILTAGMLTGWRASGLMREAGQMKAALIAELPELEDALADTRTSIRALDQEWEESRDCHREESLAALVGEAGRLAGENAKLRAFLEHDRQTMQVLSLLAGGPEDERAPREIAGDLRGALPALGFPPDKEWLLTRYVDNLAREAAIVDGIGSLTDGEVRRTHQPEVETLRRIEAELVPAVARVREDLAAPEQEPSFDTAAFARASWPSLVLFCGFVWAVGGLIEMMGSAVTLLGAGRPTVNEEGQLKWAE